MQRWNTVCCPFCSAKKFEVLCTKGRFKQHVNFSICQSCGFVYLNPRLTKTAYNKYYENEYDAVISRRPGTGRSENYELITKRLSPVVLTKNPTILDIGAGTGDGTITLGQDLKSSRLFAIEPSATGIEHLKKNNITVITSDAEKKWSKNEPFDVIVLRHVFEHFLEPQAVLEQITKHMSAKSLLYIAVPNLLHPDVVLKQDGIRLEHTLYFTPNSLEDYLLMHGLKVVKKWVNDQHSFGEIAVICKKTKPIKWHKQSSYVATKQLILKRLKEQDRFGFKLRRKLKVVFIKCVFNPFLRGTKIGSFILKRYHQNRKY